MLGYFLDPVRCCCAQDEVCISKLGSKAEILDDTGPRLPSSAELLIEGRKYNTPCGKLPAGPTDRAIRTFATSEDEPLRGAPIRSGGILQLKLGEAIEDIQLTLYINGFSRQPQNPRDAAQMQAEAYGRTWSPFSLVEKCQVKTMQHSSLWAVFKLTVFRQEGHDRYYYFATTGKDAFKERDVWVADIANAIRQVTLSLFPPHAITVRPLPGMHSTESRIMAGYLLRSQAEADRVSLFYCELHAYSAGEARLSIYKDEWCEREVGCVSLTDQTVVSTRKGSYCTVFGIDQHRFCARTCDEKELWLRAVSNIKVKLMFDAPDPTTEDLAVFRAAVLERIVKIELSEPESEPGSSGRIASPETWDPLLPQMPRVVTPISPRGDIWMPEPIVEDVDLPSVSTQAFEFKVTFIPGLTGVRYAVDTGEILTVQEGAPAHLAGVEVGMRMVEIDGQKFNDTLFKAAKDGTTPYKVTFFANRQVLDREFSDDSTQGEPLDRATDAVEALHPEECRKLLASVSPFVGAGDCGSSFDIGLIASEQPGLIRTVHTTDKALMNPKLGACENPEEMCTVTCQGDAEQDSATGPPATQQQAQITPHVPLLMWSPGRRQVSQRAI